jgi:hypothetical protein
MGPRQAMYYLKSSESFIMQVWDYVGDGYVHRLVQSHHDGKLVEVPSPDPRASQRGQRQCIGGASGPRQEGRGVKGQLSTPVATASGLMESVDEEHSMHDDINMLEVVLDFLWTSLPLC